MGRCPGSDNWGKRIRKEVVAGAIHNSVVVQETNMDDKLCSNTRKPAESELFGHEKVPSPEQQACKGR